MGAAVTMRPIELEPIAAVPAIAKPRAKRGTARTGAASPDDTPLVRAFATAGWLGPAAGSGRVTVQCPWESSHTTGVRFDSSTIIFCASPSRPRGWFHCSHGHCVSRSQFEVLDALPPEAREIVRPTPKPVELSSPDLLTEASSAIVEAIRAAGDGLTVIAAECGIGKSHAFELVAAEREASKPRDEETGRAPRGTKTAISVPTHALAKQTAENLRKNGASVLRIFSPFSMKNEDTGEHECRFFETAKHLVDGRQSGQWELCEGRGKDPCIFKDTCRAAGGTEGPATARIFVGPHQLVGELDARAGGSGLLGIDEPPTMLETEIFTDDDFATAVSRLAFFGRRYAFAIKPALRALRAYLGMAELDEVCSAVDAVRHGSEAIDESELENALIETEADFSGEVADRVLACVRGAQYPDHRGSAPPVARFHIDRAKLSPAHAEEIGQASRVLWTVHRAVTSEAPVSVRVEERRDRRVMLVTMGNDSMARALRREGSVVVLDANADVEVLAKLVGYEPTVYRFTVPDGAPVHRTHIKTSVANKANWEAHGRIVLRRVVGALRSAVDWVLEEPSTRVVGIIAPKLIELAMRVARGDGDAEWRAARQTEPAAEVRRVLSPVLDLLGDIMLVPGHYGALRGLNHMASVDALVTLGDPWPNLGDVRNEAFFLGLGDAWEGRYETKARAELEQAHGRLRAVQRRRQARALHVGALLPSGSAWSKNVDVRRTAMGRPPTDSRMPPDEAARLTAALGGVRATAKALGCGASTVSRYSAGTTAVPLAVSERLRELALALSGTRDPLALCRILLLRDQQQYSAHVWSFSAVAIRGTDDSTSSKRKALAL